MSSPWTRFEDLVATLRRRWERGQYLRTYSSGDLWESVTLPVKGPTATEMLENFDEVLRWAEQFRKDSRTARGRPRVTVECRTVKNRLLGHNELPARIRIDTFEELATLLGTNDAVRALDRVLDQTTNEAPALATWVTRNPCLAIEHHSIWTDLLATVNWISGHDTTQLYLRHIDVAGVDTKFVERHQKILGQLLSSSLPAARIDLGQRDFARRYGFRAKPRYTRFRLFASLSEQISGVTELRLRTDELAETPMPVGTVFIVENEVSYLAFPEVRDAMVVFGEGFHLTTLESLPWLKEKQIVYWGDIDTHGFAILSRLRARFPSTSSILMDHDTLLAHPGQYVTEPTPTREPQPHLSETERSLYQDLIEDRFGPAIRLEQERVRFSLLRRELHPWMTCGS